MATSTTSVSRETFRACCLIAVFCLLGCAEEQRQFAELRKNRRDTTQAKQIATSLKDRPQAIDIALRDFDCFGGTTRGWANWMLEYSSLLSVNEALQGILLDAQERHSRRVAAAWIIWRRTHEDEHLRELFRLVKDPGETSVQMGRRFLSMTTTNAAIRDALTRSPSSALPVTEAIFTDYIRNGQVGLDLNVNTAP